MAGDAFFDFHFRVAKISSGDATKHAGGHPAQFREVAHLFAKRAAGVGDSDAVGRAGC